MSKKSRLFIPNIISFVRMMLSVILLLVKPDTASFIMIYCICGLTDVADGYLARKWNVSSRVGALIDSIADFIFTAVLFVIYIPRFEWESWMILWISIIAVLRGLSLLVGALKYHTFAFVHTYGNKVTGLFLFLFPFFLRLSGLLITVIIIGTVASFSAAEELCIMVSSDTLNRDRKGLRKHSKY